MNNFYKKIILFIFLALGFGSVQAQNAGHAPLEEVVSAIRVNRMQDIDKYMESFVTISINNIQSIYSHNQAQVILRDFFDKNDPKDLLVMDSGTPTSSSAFVIGGYDAANGTKYIVYVLMKMKDNKFVLQEIRVNKD